MLGTDGGYGHQHGEKFPYGKAQHCHADGGGFPKRQDVTGCYVYASDPGDLFQKLGSGRDASFFYAVKIAVDTGMYGGQGHGKGQDPQHGGRARFPEQAQGNGICEEEENRIAEQGKG